MNFVRTYFLECKGFEFLKMSKIKSNAKLATGHFLFPYHKRSYSNYSLSSKILKAPLIVPSNNFLCKNKFLRRINFGYFHKNLRPRFWPKIAKLIVVSFNSWKVIKNTYQQSSIPSPRRIDIFNRWSTCIVITLIYHLNTHIEVNATFPLLLVLWNMDYKNKRLSSSTLRFCAGMHLFCFVFGMY